MFIRTNPAQTGYRGTDQVAGGLFLIAFCAEDDQYDYEHPERGVIKYQRLWCAVRPAKLRQLGHFMMGNMKIWRYQFSLSGGFGNDGLPSDYSEYFPLDDVNRCPCRCSRKLDALEIEWLKRHYLTVMPDDLSTRYWLTGGHNQVGESSVEIRIWAERNMHRLRREPKKPSRGDTFRVTSLWEGSEAFDIKVGTTLIMQGYEKGVRDMMRLQIQDVMQRIINVNVDQIWTTIEPLKKKVRHGLPC